MKHINTTLIAIALAVLGGCSSGGGDDSSGSEPPVWRDDSDCRGGDGSVTLNWLPPQYNEDGSVLTDLAGYKLHFGREGWGLTRTIRLPAGISEYRLEGLRSGNCVLALTAYDAVDHEGDFSEDVLVTTP